MHVEGVHDGRVGGDEPDPRPLVEVVGAARVHPAGADLQQAVPAPVGPAGRRRREEGWAEK